MKYVLLNPYTQMGTNLYTQMGNEALKRAKNVHRNGDTPKWQPSSILPNVKGFLQY